MIEKKGKWMRLGGGGEGLPPVPSQGKGPTSEDCRSKVMIWKGANGSRDHLLFIFDYKQYYYSKLH